MTEERRWRPATPSAAETPFGPGRAGEVSGDGYARSLIPAGSWASRITRVRFPVPAGARQPHVNGRRP